MNPHGINYGVFTTTMGQQRALYSAHEGLGVFFFFLLHNMKAAGLIQKKHWENYGKAPRKDWYSDGKIGILIISHSQRK